MVATFFLLLLLGAIELGISWRELNELALPAEPMMSSSLDGLQTLLDGPDLKHKACLIVEIVLDNLLNRSYCLFDLSRRLLLYQQHGLLKSRQPSFSLLQLLLH